MPRGPLGAAAALGSALWRAKYGLGGLMGTGLIWNLAVAITAGGRFIDPLSGIRSLLALGLPQIDVPTPNTRTIITALVLAMFAAIAVGIVVLLVRRHRAKDKSSGRAGQLAGFKDLKAATAADADMMEGAPLFYSHGRGIRMRREDNGVILAPPRMGKTMFLVLALIVDALGAVVVTSTKPDVLRLTILIRRMVGNVFVFDPERVSRWKKSIKWDIVTGCDDPEVAAERSAAMVAASGFGAGDTNSFFQNSSRIVLRSLMQAAALKPGGNMRDVVRWASNFEDNEPYDILDTHPGATPGWVDLLRKFCRGKAPETISSTDQSLSQVLDVFSIPRMLDSVCPAPGEGFDPSTFYQTRDTLYLLTQSGQASLGAAIFTALITAVERQARVEAGRTASGRIDPPLRLVLDECANVAPIPSLPSLMSDGGGRGVQAFPVFQDQGQVIERYGRDSARTVLGSATAFFMLGGSKDLDHLRELSGLGGDKAVPREIGNPSAGADYRPLIDVPDIRTAAVGTGLLFYRNLAPTFVSFKGWWQRADAALFQDSLKTCLQAEGIDADDQAIADALLAFTSADLPEDTPEDSIIQMLEAAQ